MHNKKKVWRNNLHPFVQAPTANFTVFLLSYSGSSALLSSCFTIPVLLLFSPLIPALLSPLIPASFSLPVSALLSLLLPALLSHSVPALVTLPVLALLSYSVLGLVLIHLTSSAFRTFKQTLSNEFLSWCSTSSVELLCLFLIFGPLPKKKKCKRPFNMVFINSLPLTSNYFAKKIDLSFRKCSSLTPAKFNWL